MNTPKTYAREWARDKYAIAGSPESGEEYLVSVLDDSAHGHFPVPCPIVQVLRVAKYPCQRAIAHPEIPVEIPPVPPGSLCRLRVIRPAADDEKALLDLTWTQAAARAIGRSMEETDSQEEKNILLRHLAGDIRRKRAVLSFTYHDLQYLRFCESYQKRVHKHELPESVDELPGDH